MHSILLNLNLSNIKKIFKSFLQNTSVLLVLSLTFSILFPKYSIFLEQYLIYLLIIMMTFSLQNTDLNLKNINKKIIKKTINLSLINYILLPIIIVLSSLLIIKNQNYINGFILIASVPCAIVVIPFSKLLKGDVFLSAFGLFFNYLLSIILTPLIVWLFFKESINIQSLLRTIFLLVIIPLLFSRILKKSDNLIFKNKLKKYDKIIINLIFVITTYAFIGINLSEFNFLNQKKFFLSY